MDCLKICSLWKRERKENKSVYSQLFNEFEKIFQFHKGQPGVIRYSTNNINKVMNANEVVVFGVNSSLLGG